MSRLPPPPRGKPPAPEPSTIPNSGDAPPPLPSRPGGKPLAKGKNLPPPPRINGAPSAAPGPDDYIEPDDWTDGGGPQAPSLPPRNFEPSEGGELYEEPDANVMPPPPVSRPPHKQTPATPSESDGGGELYEEPDMSTPPPPSVSRAQPKPPPTRPASQGGGGSDGEIYDDLDEPAQEEMLDDEPGETYDACNFEGEEQDMSDDGELYQEPDQIQDDTYEVMPPGQEPSGHRPPPTPPPVTSTPPRRAPNTPTTNKAPAPPPDNKPDLPQRNTPQPPKVVKTSGPQITAAISLNELSQGMTRLRKVSSQEVTEPDPPSPTPTNREPEPESGSVLARAKLFQDNHNPHRQEGDLHSEILNARNLLRSSKKAISPKPQTKLPHPSSETPSLSPATGRPAPPTKPGKMANDTSLTISTTSSNTNNSSTIRPTSGLSIKERIALMKQSQSPDNQSQISLPKPVPQARSCSPEPRAHTLSPVPTPGARQASSEPSASRQPLKPPLTPVKPKKVESSSSQQLPQPPTIQKKDSEHQPSSTIVTTQHNMLHDHINTNFKTLPHSDTGAKKPSIPVKPVILLSAKSLGPPPPPPVTAMPPPPDPPTLQSPVQKFPPPRSPSPELPPPPQYDDGELYDEGFSYMDPMQGQEWFHGSLDRGTTTQRLKSIGEDGTFLVRKATKDNPTQPYTLVVLYQGKEYNLKIRKRDDTQVALGEVKPNEMTFSDVAALVEHHKKHEVILVNSKENKQHQTILKRSPAARR